MPGQVSIYAKSPIVHSQISEQPQAETSRLQQVSPVHTARTHATDKANASSKGSLEALQASGNLKAVTGYRPSVKSWVSGKISSAINFLKGQNASAPILDRRGDNTFRELERLATNVSTTAEALKKNSNRSTQSAYRESLVDFHAAVSSYNSNKTGRLPHADALMSSILDELVVFDLEVDRVSNPSLKQSGALLRKTGMYLPDMKDDQQIRLATMLLKDPARAREVVNRAGPNARHLDVILDAAKEASFDTRSQTERIAAKRAQLTADTDSGGLGVDPAKLNRTKTLGAGCFGEVRLYKSENSNPTKVQQFAGKVIQEKKISELYSEEAMLARLPDHPNLVKSFGIHKIGDEDVLVQELVSGGSFREIIDDLKLNQLPAEQQLLVLKHVATQVFRGLAELQKLGIVHSDVRAGNLLFDENTFDIKLADFGLASERGVHKELFPIKWTSPEVLREGRRTSILNDTFSASRVLVGELVDHVNLFNTNKESQPTKQDIFAFTNEQVQQASKSVDELPQELPPVTVEVLNDIDPSGKMADFFSAISNPDPNKRLRADEVLKHEFLADPPTHEQLAEIFKRKAEPAMNAPPKPTGLYGLV